MVLVGSQPIAGPAVLVSGPAVLVRPFQYREQSNCTMTATDLELESEAIQRITQPFPPGKAKGSPAFPRDCTRAVEAASQRNGRSTWCL